MPDEYLVGKILAHDVVNTDSGEIAPRPARSGRPASVEQIISAGVTEVCTLCPNDLDQGPYISTTLRIDPTKQRIEALVEIYRMMRPGEPPTATRPRTCSTTCSSTASATICRPSAA